MRLRHFFIDAALPTPRNSYRPRLLNKSTVTFFLAAALVAEAYFVSGLFGANPAEPLLAALLYSAAGPQAANWALVGVVVLLGILLAAAAMVHWQVQASDILLPGVVVLGIALLLLVLNAWYGGAYG